MLSNMSLFNFCHLISQLSLLSTKQSLRRLVCRAEIALCLAIGGLNMFRRIKCHFESYSNNLAIYTRSVTRRSEMALLPAVI
jgi:hypothetical protein